MIMCAAALPRALSALRKAVNEPATNIASRISFETSDTEYQKVYTSALETLNTRDTITVSGFPEPVLIEGSNYAGIWPECAPQEGLVYADVRRDAARNNHLAFFALQKEDGTFLLVED